MGQPKFRTFLFERIAREAAIYGSSDLAIAKRGLSVAERLSCRLTRSRKKNGSERIYAHIQGTYLDLIGDDRR